MSLYDSWLAHAQYVSLQFLLAHLQYVSFTVLFIVVSSNRYLPFPPLGIILFAACGPKAIIFPATSPPFHFIHTWDLRIRIWTGFCLKLADPAPGTVSTNSEKFLYCTKYIFGGSWFKLFYQVILFKFKSYSYTLGKFFPNLYICFNQLLWIFVLGNVSQFGLINSSYVLYIVQ